MITKQGINGHLTSEIGQYINCIQDRLNSNISLEWNWTDIGRFICLIVILTFILMAPLFAQPINRYCPVTTNEKIDLNIYTDYDSQRIYFCCNRCRKDFLADPTIYLANIDYGDTAESVSNYKRERPLRTKPASTDRKLGSDKVAYESTSYRYDNDTTHDHTVDHGEEGIAITFLGKLHPVVVHFPIALVLAGFFITGIAAIRRKPYLEQSSVLMIYLAAPSGIITALLGLAASAEANFPPYLSSHFTWHRILGLTSGITIWIAAFFGYLW